MELKVEVVYRRGSASCQVEFLQSFCCEVCSIPAILPDERGLAPIGSPLSGEISGQASENGTFPVQAIKEENRNMLHRKSKPNNHVKSELLRWILICIGWFSIVCGIIGLFLPLVPTVPFLLLATVCFSRSSERFHSWLVEHKHLGPLLRDYLAMGGIPLRAKIMAISMVWISFPTSAYLFVTVFWVKALLIGVAAAVTWYLVSIPTVTPAFSGKESEAE